MKIGMLGSPAHIMGNEAITDKKGCLKDVAKEGVMDTVKLTGAIGAAGAAGAAAVKISPTVASALKNVAKKGKSVAGKIFNPEMLTKLKNLGAYKKFNALPAWAKAGIGIAAAAAAIITPIWMAHSAQKSAKIEAQYEQQ